MNQKSLTVDDIRSLFRLLFPQWSSEESLLISKFSYGYLTYIVSRYPRANAIREILIILEAVAKYFAELGDEDNYFNIMSPWDIAEIIKGGELSVPTFYDNPLLETLPVGIYLNEQVHLSQSYDKEFVVGILVVYQNFKTPVPLYMYGAWLDDLPVTPRTSEAELLALPEMVDLYLIKINNRFYSGNSPLAQGIQQAFIWLNLNPDDYILVWRSSIIEDKIEWESTSLNALFLIR